MSLLLPLRMMQPMLLPKKKPVELRSKNYT